MTQRQKFQTFWKIAIFSVFLFILLQVIFFLVGNNHSIFAEKKNSEYHTSTELRSAYSSRASGAAVAISTRIWMGQNSQKISGQNTLWSYNYLSGSPLTLDFVEENIIHTQEYLNFSRIDVKQAIAQSSQKEKTLNSLISGFSQRAENAQVSIKSLELRKKETLEKLQQAQSNISQIKARMENSFSSAKPQETIDEVQLYYTEREKYTDSFTQIVFINQFLQQYNFLISRNAGMLETLKLNKTALIEGDSIVIPNIWGDYLKPLELIVDEDDI